MTGWLLLSLGIGLLGLGTWGQILNRRARVREAGQVRDRLARACVPEDYDNFRPAA